MTTLAIVPVKPFSEGKSRLDGVLTDFERYQLNEQLFKNTITVLSCVQQFERIIAISRDPVVLKLAREMGAATQLEAGRGLNQALYQVNNTLDKRMDGALVIPTDLPMLSEEDVNTILDMGKEKPVVVVVPDRHQRGTNALFVNPVGCIPYRFGSNSAKKHVAEGQKRGIRTIITQIAGMNIDLDLEEDLDLLKAKGYFPNIQVLNSMEETVR
jgi:2-phospho-L-lactate guanylyltransferase